MVKLAIRATLVAKPGKEAAVEAFLKSALPLAMREAGTTLWFALRSRRRRLASSTPSPTRRAVTRIWPGRSPLH